jgi:hypothetical protein
MVLTPAAPQLLILNDRPVVRAPARCGERLMLHRARNGFLSQLPSECWTRGDSEKAPC